MPQARLIRHAAAWSDPAKCHSSFDQPYASKA
jgi:hypothetical protein